MQEFGSQYNDRGPENTRSSKAPLSDEFGEASIWQILETVCDPEVPVLSILDLGIVRNVRRSPPPFRGWRIKWGLGNYHHTNLHWLPRHGHD